MSVIEAIERRATPGVDFIILRVDRESYISTPQVIATFHPLTIQEATELRDILTALLDESEAKQLDLLAAPLNPVS